jgi:zinc protease
MNPGASHVSPDVVPLEVEGLRVLFRPNRAHEVVAARLYLLGGSSHVPVAQAGVEAMYARTARRGTRRFPKTELNATLARLGADLGAVVSHDATTFNLRCLVRHLAEAWEVYADVVLDPLLENEDIEVVRRQMLLDVRQTLDSPDGALGEMARRHCYAGHPYAADPHGSEESLPALDAATLRAHTARCWSRASALLVVAGDLTDGEVARYARSFAGLPRGGARPGLPSRLGFEHGGLVTATRELPTNYVLGEFAAPALRDADHPAMLVAMAVLRDRFFEEVRTKRNLSYAPAASLGHDAANLGSVYVTAVDPVTTVGVMRAEMRRLMDEPLDPKELGDKVRTFVTRYWLQNETNQAQAGFVAGYELFGGGWEKSREFVPRLESLAPADVQRVARQYLRAIQWMYLGDPARAAPEAFTDP